MKDNKLFLSEENKMKFVNEEPYLEISKEGQVDFCLGKNLEEASDIFRKYLQVKEK